MFKNRQNKKRQNQNRQNVQKSSKSKIVKMFKNKNRQNQKSYVVLRYLLDVAKPSEILRVNQNDKKRKRAWVG